MAEQVTNINAEFMLEVMDWMDAPPTLSPPTAKRNPRQVNLTRV